MRPTTPDSRHPDTRIAISFNDKWNNYDKSFLLRSHANVGDTHFIGAASATPQCAAYHLLSVNCDAMRDALVHSTLLLHRHQSLKFMLKFSQISIFVYGMRRCDRWGLNILYFISPHWYVCSRGYSGFTLNENLVGRRTDWYLDEWQSGSSSRDPDKILQSFYLEKYWHW